MCAWVESLSVKARSLFQLRSAMTNRTVRNPHSFGKQYAETMAPLQAAAGLGSSSFHVEDTSSTPSSKLKNEHPWAMPRLQAPVIVAIRISLEAIYGVAS